MTILEKLVVLVTSLLVVLSLACGGTTPNQTPPPSPSVKSFIAVSPMITAGQSATLTAIFSGGTGSIDNGVGAVSSDTPVTVSPTTTTVYTLTVSNSASVSVTRFVTVTVTANTAPFIVSFNASQSTIATGGSTTLTAVFSGGVGSIDQGVGEVTSGIPVSVSPGVSTTYTLSVANPTSETISTPLTITVAPAGPTITSFTSTASSVTLGQSTTLTAVFSGGVGSIDQGVGEVISGKPVALTPSASKTYFLTVTDASNVQTRRSLSILVDQGTGNTLAIYAVYMPVFNNMSPYQGGAHVQGPNGFDLYGIYGSSQTLSLSGLAPGDYSIAAGSFPCISVYTPHGPNLFTYFYPTFAHASIKVVEGANTIHIPYRHAPCLTADRPKIHPGEATTITSFLNSNIGGTGWVASVDHGIGPVTAGQPITITPSSTTVYTMTATSSTNTVVTSTVTITVVE